MLAPNPSILRAVVRDATPKDDPRPSASGPRPAVSGKFVEVGGERLWIRGVTYGTFAPGEDGGQFGSATAVDADLAAMARRGINAIRTYTVPPRWLLDAALRHGIWVMAGLPWEQHVAFLEDRRLAGSIEARVREGVRACGGHPAILFYAVGNEIPAPIVRWHGKRKVEAFLERLYRAAKAEDPGGLVTYVNFPSTEYLQLSFLDLQCFNVYLEGRDGLTAYLARLQNLAGERPLVMAEIGLDSRRNGVDAQADTLEWQIQAAFEAGCAGAFLFAWTDEWHRGGHDVGDWDFGLTDRERRPKPALAAVEHAFAEAPFGASDAGWPSVTVVVCTYNGSATLDDCLAGLRRLRYPDLELIVVDDGSTDGSGAIADAHGIRTIRTENRGLSAARNTGLAAASGEIVAYVDDDAWPDPDWPSYLALALRDGRHAGVGGPNLPVPDSGWVAESVANAPGGPVQVLLSDTVAEHIPGCNMAFRRDRLAAIGGFDSQFVVAGDDVDVCWRLQERGWTLGFHPAAMVWHHRRPSVRAFWRQQRGYGRAEAQLERKWPAKYNTPGHLTWAGRLYGRGAAPSARRWRVYYGTWGSEPFQSALERPAGVLTSLAAAPEWYLLVAALAVLTGLGAVVPQLLLAAPLLAVAAGLPLAGAVRAGIHGHVPERAGRVERLAVRCLTAVLHLIQPLARLLGRLPSGLAPWRRPGLSGFRLPRPRTDVLWFEEWRSLHDRLASVETALRASGARLRRGGEFDRWDLHVRAGALGGVRLRTTLEDHGEGRQLMRVRLWPRASRPVLLAAAALLSAAAGWWLVAPWLAFAALALLAALVVFAVTECGMATAGVLAALPAAEKVDRRGPERREVEAMPISVGERLHAPEAVGRHAEDAERPLALAASTEDAS